MFASIKLWKLLLQLLICIIRIMLIDDIADEAIGRRRLHAKAATIAAASEPSPPSTQIIMHNLNL